MGPPWHSPRTAGTLESASNGTMLPPSTLSGKVPAAQTPGTPAGMGTARWVRTAWFVPCAFRQKGGATETLPSTLTDDALASASPIHGKCSGKQGSFPRCAGRRPGERVVRDRKTDGQTDRRADRERGGGRGRG